MWPEAERKGTKPSQSGSSLFYFYTFCAVSIWTSLLSFPFQMPVISKTMSSAKPDLCFTNQCPRHFSIQSGWQPTLTITKQLMKLHSTSHWGYIRSYWSLQWGGVKSSFISTWSCVCLQFWVPQYWGIFKRLCQEKGADLSHVEMLKKNERKRERKTMEVIFFILKSQNNILWLVLYSVY